VQAQIAVALGILGLIAVTAGPAAASTYTMTDPGNLGLGVSRGFGINAGGEVVGSRTWRRPSQPLVARPAIGA
jgi:hypothetical protein